MSWVTVSRHSECNAITMYRCLCLLSQDRQKQANAELVEDPQSPSQSATPRSPKSTSKEPLDIWKQVTHVEGKAAPKPRAERISTQASAAKHKQPKLLLQGLTPAAERALLQACAAALKAQLSTPSAAGESSENPSQKITTRDLVAEFPCRGDESLCKNLQGLCV
eukprot:9115950-Pyramimonas_sp.AAC.2